MKKKSLLIVLSICALTLFTNRLYSQQGIGSGKDSIEAQNKVSKKMDSDRVSSLKEQKKQARQQAKEAKRIDREARAASKETNSALREEKKAQKQRKQADEQAKKAAKAKEKSDQN